MKSPPLSVQAPVPLPDPEMRKFLDNGKIHSVEAALSSHVSAGLQIIELTKDAFLIRLGTVEIAGPTAQQLKKTVALANALFTGEEA